MKKINRYYLADQLETLAENVAKRGIFVIDQKQNNITIIDYVNKAVRLQDIPNIELAKVLCNKLNKRPKNSKFDFRQVQHLLNYYNKLMNDTVFYRHTIKITDDEFKREVVITRLDITVCKIKDVVTQIKQSC
jgi:hypothetical protein